MPADELPSRLDDPAVVAEVLEQFHRYEDALLANDLTILNELFWHDDRTIRLGLGENLYGYDEVKTWRDAAEPVPRSRRIVRTDVLTVGPDVAMVDCQFRNGDEPAIGRQTQVWVRTGEGWRIARAHVSLLD